MEIINYNISLLGLHSITATAIDYKECKVPSIPRRGLDCLCCQYLLDYPVLVHKEVILRHWEHFKLNILYSCNPECYPLTTLNTANAHTILALSVVIK